MNNFAVDSFKDFIWSFYNEHRRDFPWRNTNNPYHILVSEIMLQQTQTHRVVSKYEDFLLAFPTISMLAQSSLKDVLSIWQGLGYYRRARYLHQIACIVVNEHGGIIPADPSVLHTFPGLGVATASSICAFAYNMPTVFIETNIRTVFLHSFFYGQHAIKDAELLPLIAETVDQHNPREWYYALMDYGVYLKAQYPNPSRKSAHYTKQSKFAGSSRQLRAAILKLITEHDTINKSQIIQLINKDENCIESIIKDLMKESFIQEVSASVYSIT